MALRPGVAPPATPTPTPAPAPVAQPTNTAPGTVPDTAIGWDAANLRLAQLKQLRAALDSGQLAVKDFIAQAQPLSQKILDDANSLSKRDSTGAQQSAQIIPQLQSLGFDYDKSDNSKVMVNLPEKYQQDLRDATQPSNLDQGTKDRIDTIPNNINVGTDQYNIEQEGARQAQQQADLAATQKAQHATNLGDYAKLLATNQNNLFNQEVPGLAEQANVKGIYRSTGFGDSLAKEYANLTKDTQTALGQKAIQYGDMDTAALGNAVNIAQSYQGQGLNRSLSLEDYNKQVQDAVKYGKEFQPVNQGKTGGEKWMQGISAASEVANAGAKVAGK